MAISVVKVASKGDHSDNVTRKPYWETLLGFWIRLPDPSATRLWSCGNKNTTN